MQELAGLTHLDGGLAIILSLVCEHPQVFVLDMCWAEGLRRGTGNISVMVANNK